MINFKTQQVDIKKNNSKSVNVLPATGHILPFAGPSDKIPVGWLLCDGSNGTPDLRGKIVGGKSGIAVLGTEVHTHTFTDSSTTVSSVSGAHGSNVVNATSMTQSGGHSHGHTDGIEIQATYSGPANRSNGTQANVINQYHSHGGGNSYASTNTSSSYHNHSINSYNAADTSSTVSHTHSLSSNLLNSQTGLTHSLPSIFYINFIMKA